MYEVLNEPPPPWKTGEVPQALRMSEENAGGLQCTYVYSRKEPYVLIGQWPDEWQVINWHIIGATFLNFAESSTWDDPYVAMAAVDQWLESNQWEEEAEDDGP